MIDLLLSFFDDGGIITINDCLFSKLNTIQTSDDDGDLEVGDAVAILRLFVQLIESGVGDALISGARVMSLIQNNLPDLHLQLTDAEYGVAPPISSRFNLSRFCVNFRTLMVSYLDLETQSHSPSTDIIVVQVFVFP